MESSEKMWSTREGSGKPLQYSCLENLMNSMKRQKDRTRKDELPRSVGDQHATEEGNGKPLQYSCLENLMNSMKRQKDKTLRDEFPRPVSVQYATAEEWRNGSRRINRLGQSENNAQL